MVHLISIHASSAQKGKLRNGHKVRVKHGAGFNLIVSPTSYHLVSRAFNRNKGITLQLTPEEIEMNRAPNPELQSQLLGHTQHMVLPGVVDHLGGRGLGTGVKEFFQNIGNKLKGAYEKVKDTIQTPIENAIINPIKNAYEQNVPESIRRDISTGAKIASPAYLIQDMIKKVKEGKNPVEMYKQYKDDLLHLNKTKNKVIQSSPVLTELYKKGVMTTAGLGSAALGTTLGLNPATGALAGAAGSMAARELLKAEGYGLHHAIEHGEKHHYHELKHHSKPIGGALKMSHVTNFFKNAGNKLKQAFQQATPYVKKGAQEVHNFILNNPELAKKIKEHGSKLAGMFAKAGANYLSGDEKYGEEAEKYGSKFGDEQIHKNLGYGIGDDIERGGREGVRRVKNLFGKGVGDDIERGGREGIRRVKNLFGKGVGDDIERGVRQGADRVKNFFGRAIEHGELHHYDELKHHSRPIGGALKMSHVTNFFKNAGNKLKQAFQQATPYVKKGAQEVHNFILNNPELAKKIKEHGSKLAGMFAKMGANYLSGDEKYGEEAEKYGSKFGEEQIHKNLGYGLYAGRQGGRGFGIGGLSHYQHGSYTPPPNAPPPPPRVGKGFDSFNSLYNANMGYSNALSKLGRLSDTTIHGQHMAEPIKRYWDSDGQPPSRGYGIRQNHHAKVHHARTSGFERGNHHNLIRGKGTLLEHNTILPPALQSQPYGSNFHMQFMLPPQYQKYNDGTNEY